MKTLVNKANPAIRIIAPEIIELAYSYEIQVEDNKSSHWFYAGKDYWTLVEEGMLPGFEDEEPTEGLGITETCVPPIIVETLNRFGWKVEKGYVEEEPEKANCPSDEELQRLRDELYSFKVFAAKQAKEHHISFVHDFEWDNFCAALLSYFAEQKEQKPVDLEKEIDRLWDDFSDEISGPHNKFDIYARIARHFYELGRKGGNK